MSKSSPARIEFKRRRAIKRANDPAVQERARMHTARRKAAVQAAEREERAQVDAVKLAEARKIAEAIHNGD